MAALEDNGSTLKDLLFRVSELFLKLIGLS